MKKILLALLITVGSVAAIDITFRNPTSLEIFGLKHQANIRNAELGTNVYTWQTFAQTNVVQEMKKDYDKKLGQWAGEALRFERQNVEKRQMLQTLATTLPQLTTNQLQTLIDLLPAEE